jgi:hypothetical protein
LPLFGFSGWFGLLDQPESAGQAQIPHACGIEVRLPARETHEALGTVLAEIAPALQPLEPLAGTSLLFGGDENLTDIDQMGEHGGASLRGTVEAGAHLDGESGKIPLRLRGN